MSSSFFGRVDRVLRRSLGVSEHARTDDSVKPAPPVDPELPPIEELYKMPPKEGEAGIYIPPHMQDDVCSFLVSLTILLLILLSLDGH